MIKKNLGTPGRLFRLGIALALLIYAYWNMSWIALLFGLFTFFEAFMGWCIVYQFLGKNSCPIKKKK